MSTPSDKESTTHRPSITTVQKSAILGAAFLMATSAVGPGFLTQTATFTEKLGASFGFVILNFDGYRGTAKCLASGDCF